MTGTDPISPIVVGFGGNVGSDAEIVDRFRQARRALAGLAMIDSVQSAPLYRSAPIGPDQPAYLNTAVCLTFDVEPMALLRQLQAIERCLGRDRTIELRWGPRTIDLDWLLWGERVVRETELVVPHPRLAERKFALAPIVSLLGEGFVIPGCGIAGGLFARVDHQDCESIATAW